MATQSLDTGSSLDICKLSFKEVFDRTELFENQESDALVVDEFIRKQPEDSWVGLDLRGLKYLGYSYAKPTVRRPVMRQVSGEYGQKRILLIGDQDESFFDGIERALLDKELVALLAAAPDEPISGWRILGDLPGHLQDTFERLLEDGPISTSDFAKRIGQSVPNTNARLQRLRSLGLIRRYKGTNPTGGREWVNSAL